MSIFFMSPYEEGKNTRKLSLKRYDGALEEVKKCNSSDGRSSSLCSSVPDQEGQKRTVTKQERVPLFKNLDDISLKEPYLGDKKVEKEKMSPEEKDDGMFLVKSVKSVEPGIFIKKRTVCGNTGLSELLFGEKEEKEDIFLEIKIENVKGAVLKPGEPVHSIRHQSEGCKEISEEKLFPCNKNSKENVSSTENKGESLKMKEKVDSPVLLINDEIDIYEESDDSSEIVLSSDEESQENEKLTSRKEEEDKLLTMKTKEVKERVEEPIEPVPFIKQEIIEFEEELDGISEREHSSNINKLEDEVSSKEEIFRVKIKEEPVDEPDDWRPVEPVFIKKEIQDSDSEACTPKAEIDAALKVKKQVKQTKKASESLQNFASKQSSVIKPVTQRKHISHGTRSIYNNIANEKSKFVNSVSKDLNSKAKLSGSECGDIANKSIIKKSKFQSSCTDLRPTNIKNKSQGKRVSFKTSDITNEYTNEKSKLASNRIPFRKSCIVKPADQGKYTLSKSRGIGRENMEEQSKLYDVKNEEFDSEATLSADEVVQIKDLHSYEHNYSKGISFREHTAAQINIEHNYYASILNSDSSIVSPFSPKIIPRTKTTLTQWDRSNKCNSYKKYSSRNIEQTSPIIQPDVYFKQCSKLEKQNTFHEFSKNDCDSDAYLQQGHDKMRQNGAKRVWLDRKCLMNRPSSTQLKKKKRTCVRPTSSGRTEKNIRKQDHVATSSSDSDDELSESSDDSTDDESFVPSVFSSASNSSTKKNRSSKKVAIKFPFKGKRFITVSYHPKRTTNSRRQLKSHPPKLPKKETTIPVSSTSYPKKKTTKSRRRLKSLSSKFTKKEITIKIPDPTKKGTYVKVRDEAEKINFLKVCNLNPRVNLGEKVPHTENEIRMFLFRKRLRQKIRKREKTDSDSRKKNMYQEKLRKRKYPENYFTDFDELFGDSDDAYSEDESKPLATIKESLSFGDLDDTNSEDELKPLATIKESLRQNTKENKTLKTEFTPPSEKVPSKENVVHRTEPKAKPLPAVSSDPFEHVFFRIKPDGSIGEIHDASLQSVVPANEATTTTKLNKKAKF